MSKGLSNLGILGRQVIMLKHLHCTLLAQAFLRRVDGGMHVLPALRRTALGGLDCDTVEGFCDGYAIVWVRVHHPQNQFLDRCIYCVRAQLSRMEKVLTWRPNELHEVSTFRVLSLFAGRRVWMFLLPASPAFTTVSRILITIDAYSPFMNFL